MGTLVMVRHGESRWNLCNRFTGWVDVPLSENGIIEARACSVHCRKFDFDAAFTSHLERARETLLIILALQGRTAIVQHREDSRYRRWLEISSRCGAGDIPVFTSPLLNERYYGDMQGMEKAAASRKYGSKKVLEWRRSYNARPPGGESLRDTFIRTRPFFARQIEPRIRRGGTVLLVGHGNTLRAIIKYLEGISDEEVSFIDLPEARPLAYSYRRGRYERTAGEYNYNRPFR